jgi:hypothetical protein
MQRPCLRKQRKKIVTVLNSFFILCALFKFSFLDLADSIWYHFFFFSTKLFLLVCIYFITSVVASFSSELVF